MAQIVKHLPSKYEALSSIPNTAKKWKQPGIADIVEGHFDNQLPQ
jgi:hypothetical protein